MDITSEPPAATSCFTCRATGSATFFGVALYLLHERSHVSAASLGHRRLLAGLAAASLALSAARWRW
jgi:hypothetical protein